MDFAFHREIRDLREKLADFILRKVDIGIYDIFIYMINAMICDICCS